MPPDALTLVLLGTLGLAIGFVGGLVGLVLGVLRFPIILSTAETSVAIAAGTNIGVSTLGALAGAIMHFKQNNVHFRVFTIMAGAGAVGAFIGAFLTRYVPVQFFFISIGLIVSYEAFSLIKSSKRTISNEILVPVVAALQVLQTWL
jgi:uncharacterized protein